MGNSRCMMDCASAFFALKLERHPLTVIVYEQTDTYTTRSRAGATVHTQDCVVKRAPPLPQLPLPFLFQRSTPSEGVVVCAPSEQARERLDMPLHHSSTSVRRISRFQPGS